MQLNQGNFMAAAVCPICKTSANMAQCPRCGHATVMDEIFDIKDGGAFPSNHRMNELGAVDPVAVEKALGEWLLTFNGVKK